MRWPRTGGSPTVSASPLDIRYKMCSFASCALQFHSRQVPSLGELVALWPGSQGWGEVAPTGLNLDICLQLWWNLCCWSLIITSTDLSSKLHTWFLKFISSVWQYFLKQKFLGLARLPSATCAAEAGCSLPPSSGGAGTGRLESPRRGKICSPFQQLSWCFTTFGPCFWP